MDFVQYLNDNQGLVSFVIFVLTIGLGWASGIFSSLRRKPKLKAKTLPGPTFFSVFPTGRTFEGHEVHRIAFAIYLSIKNVGTAPTTIESVQLGYTWAGIPIGNPRFIKYAFFPYWITDQTVILDDFRAEIGENIKIYPSLFQTGIFQPGPKDCYLEIGKSTSGVVYFEQTDSYGSFRPKNKGNQSKIWIKIVDVFGRSYIFKFKIPHADLAEASKLNPTFGRTLASLRNEILPIDAGRLNADSYIDGSGI